MSLICHLCPRECGVDRSVKKGYCGMGENPRLARAALHFWEEPCISGTQGSGTVFFARIILSAIRGRERKFPFPVWRIFSGCWKIRGRIISIW